jgi:hypothetical protein
MSCGNFSGTIRGPRNERSRNQAFHCVGAKAAGITPPSSIVASGLLAQSPHQSDLIVPDMAALAALMT